MKTLSELLKEITPGLLTVRAQTVSPNDNGVLLWDTFMPRVDVPSVKVKTYTTQRFRPASDRREWDQPGRLIPRKVGPISEIEMVPIESFFRITEKEMQELGERFGDQLDRILATLMLDVPTRSDDLARANLRRVEIDVFSAWATGTVVATDPADGTTQTMSYGFDAGRFQTANPTWTAAANAFDAFMAWLRDGVDQVGPLEGAVMRQATFNAILADAPTDLTGLVTRTKRQTEEIVSDLLGTDFGIFVNELTVDRFATGSTATTSTKVWPAEQVAAIPAGGTVGETAYAPVIRAYDISAAEADAEIDQNGQKVYMHDGNRGESLTVECQLNALPLPDEQKMWVIDAGV